MSASDIEVLTFPCAMCGTPYSQTRRRATKYCVDCRELRRVERKRLINVSRNRARGNVVDIVSSYTAQGMDVDYAELMLGRLDAVIDELMPVEMSHPELPITGALSPAGPDEGTSTYFGDLREELEYASSLVAEHEWWSAHPNWAVGLSADEVDINLSRR
jgi:hypothetical protein